MSAGPYTEWNPTSSWCQASTRSGSSSSRPDSRTWSTVRARPGRLQLYVDGTLAGNAEAPVTNPFVLNPGALTCGANPGSAITDDYASPFKFTGTIHSVTVDVSGELIEDSEAELRVHMARQ